MFLDSKIVVGFNLSRLSVFYIIGEGLVFCFKIVIIDDVKKFNFFFIMYFDEIIIVQVKK